jgi:SdpC family antimicrobial peptide
MKNIRKIASNPMFIITLTISFLFASCSSDTNNENIELSKSISNSKISGEDLFKSIFFSDGALTGKVTSLNSSFDINSLNKSELAKYRASEKEAIDYLKGIDSNYFNKFQSNIYLKDPETISNTIKKAAMDIVPFVNGKLSVQGLSIEKISKTIKKDAKGEIDLTKAESQMKQMCGVWALAIGVAVVAVVVFYVAAISEFYVSKMMSEKNSLALEAISIQTAQSL